MSDTALPSEFADVFARIARLDPLRGAEPAPLGFALDDFVDRLVATPPSGPAPDRHEARTPARLRSRRRWRAVVAGGLLVVAAGGTAAAIVAARRPDRPNEPARCRSTAEPAAFPSGVLVDGPDPLAACAEAWADGLVPGQPGGSVPPLAACVGLNGVVEILPAGPGSCEALGLEPAELDPAPPTLELQNRLAAATVERCLPLDEAAAMAVALFDELALDGWAVRRNQAADPDLPCTRVLVDAVTRTVVLVPGPKP